MHFVIVGGGPAGLACAIEARLAGAYATVIERCGGPVDKACGEGLMPSGVARLNRLGVVPPAWGTHSFRGIRYIDASGPGPMRTADAEFSGGPGLGVRRLALSEAMRARAVELGVQIHEKTEALGFREDRAGPGGVTVETSGGPVHGDWLIGADGLHSQVRKWAQIPAITGPERRLGVRRHFTITPWSEFVEVWWADGVEAYVTPVGPQRVGVAFLWSGKKKGDFDGFLQEFPELAARLGPPESALRGAGPFDVRVETQKKGRALLVGDATGYVDALTGEGIALALEQAEALVGMVLSGIVDAWPARCRAMSRRHRWFTRGLLRIARRPWLRHRMIHLLAAQPWVFRLGLNAGAARPLLPG